MADTPETPTTSSTPRRLRAVKPGEGTDIVRPVRQWWNKTLAEAPDQVSLPQAMSDLGVMALAHLAKRLASDKTPQRVKDQIALAMGPKLAVHVVGKGKLPGGGSGDAGRTLIEAYTSNATP